MVFIKFYCPFIINLLGLLHSMRHYLLRRGCRMYIEAHKINFQHKGSCKTAMQEIAIKLYYISSFANINDNTTKVRCYFLMHREKKKNFQTVHLLSTFISLVLHLAPWYVCKLLQYNKISLLKMQDVKHNDSIVF